MIYTQRDEQAFILHACAGSERRRLLDIGAYHPTKFSNSRALIEQGWQAVLIEPSPYPVRDLLLEYGKSEGIIVLCAAVATEPGIIPIHISDDAVSTSETENMRTWQSYGAGFIGALHVPCFTIKQILDRFGEFDMVSIDTEGTSLAVFRDLLATEMFPRCIVVEHDGKVQDAIAAAQGRGYHLVHQTEENLVFGL